MERREEGKGWNRQEEEGEEQKVCTIVCREHLYMNSPRGFLFFEGSLEGQIHHVCVID